ncbi:MAG TPA: type II secretion system protein [Gemmatimonadaceae bacterium]|jgi:type IV pilus assembly protein PilA|nr:type II secretion system protein [Gemmatimonadaceae bacterium]
MNNQKRRGFSLLELLIVVAMMGILATLGLPKFRLVRDKNNVNAARARVESMVASARAAAVHKGRLSLFVMSGNLMAVWTQDPTTGAWQQQIPYYNVSTVYPGVNLQVGGAGLWYVYFEPRGLTWATARPPGTLVFRVVGQTKSDSVCVSRMGQILPRGCAP